MDVVMIDFVRNVERLMDEAEEVIDEDPHLAASKIIAAYRSLVCADKEALEWDWTTANELYKERVRVLDPILSTRDVDIGGAFPHYHLPERS